MHHVYSLPNDLQTPGRFSEANLMTKLDRGVVRCVGGGRTQPGHFYHCLHTLVVGVTEILSGDPSRQRKAATLWLRLGSHIWTRTIHHIINPVA